MLVEKIYKVYYFYGVVNPIEKSIEITTVSSLNEEYIREQIIQKNNLTPLEANQILQITSIVLIGTKRVDDGPITLESLKNFK